jgi:hypothetical protein
MLLDRLRLMFEWYKGMVDEETGRLLYLYDPGAEVSVGDGDGELIRNIAAIWDVEMLSGFLGRDELRSLIQRSLDHFEHLIVERDGYAIVAPQREQSSIAHSAFLAHAQGPIMRWRNPTRRYELLAEMDGCDIGLQFLRPVKGKVACPVGERCLQICTN